MVAKSAAQPPQRRHRTLTTCDGVPRDGNENQNEFALAKNAPGDGTPAYVTMRTDLVGAASNIVPFPKR